jgi:sulfite exporter TauE/SafE
MLFGTAFALGIFSSVHCIGMCGPIALATPVVNKNFFTQILSRIMYNSGRAISYMSIGLIAGSIGGLFALTGIQQLVSVLSGIIILIWIILPKTNPENWKIMQKLGFVKFIRNKIRKLFKQKRYSSIFLIGALNGFLPCGMVYMAVMGALTTSDFTKGGLYMMFFALGTWPLMFILSSTWELVSINFRKRSRKMLPYFVGMIGVILIVRGIGIGIPYLSPSFTPDEHSMAICK